MSQTEGPKEAKPNKAQPKTHGIWEGQLMPTILRGSAEHNKRVLAQRARIDGLVTAPLKVSAGTINTSSDMAYLLEKAKAVIAELPTEPQKSKSPSSAENTKQSTLFCEEKWESPTSSPEKKPTPVVLEMSPFSKTKIKARKVGLSLSEECRGVYTQEALDARIQLFAGLKKRL